ncbi:MAG TPA: response regulator [Mycobacteriales bacterium]|nr:response regulator [Mycobacteriales bacterium]
MPGSRVLVVDDEDDILDLLEIWLGDDDRCADYARCNDLDAVVAQAQGFAPDVIVLDVWFGARTSVGILPLLRTACPQSTIVIHTASERAARSLGVLTLGADDIIEKAEIPIDQVVDRVLRHAEGRRPTVIDLTAAESVVDSPSRPAQLT